MQVVLSKLNAALIQEDESGLMGTLQSCDLNELLGQDTLTHVRARAKTRLTLFLATLAVHNEIETPRAKHWLEAYQSINQGHLGGHFQTLGKQHVLRQALQALINKKSLESNRIKKLSGSVQAWKDAFELLIDHRDWSSALTMLHSLGSAKSDMSQWIEIAKSLSKRHHLYVDQTGIRQVDIDYHKLALIYQHCALAAKQGHMDELARALIHLQASALETAGEYEKAITMLKGMSAQATTSSPLIDMARCMCKSGDLSAAIETLDELLWVLDENTHVELEKIDSESDKKEEQEKPKTFNVAAATWALKDLAQIMNARNLKYFLVSGTLLGYVREGKLLDHDKDIDVGLIGWENQYEMCMALQETGLFTVASEFLRGHKSYYIPIRHNATGMWIDVFIYHMIDGKLVTGVDFFFGYRQTFAFTPFDLKEIDFMGVKMYAPDDAELNLAENFGNWRVPDPSYISHLESPSTVNKGSLAYMLTARLTAIAAMVKRKDVKLRKVLELMRSHQDQPSAMSKDLIDLLEKRIQIHATQEEVEHAH